MEQQLKQHIFIVGAYSLQNQLLTDFIATSLEDVHCTTLSDIDQFDASGLTNTDILLLIDYNTADVETCLDKVNRIEEEDLVAHSALFNVPDENSINLYAGKLHMNGAFLQSCPQLQFIKGIRSIFDGEIWLPRKVMSSFMEKNRGLPNQFDGAGSDLTDREVVVMRVMATGASNSTIAAELDLSPHTVKTHIYNIFKKINASNRMQAVNWAQRHLA